MLSLAFGGSIHPLLSCDHPGRCRGTVSIAVFVCVFSSGFAHTSTPSFSRIRVNVSVVVAFFLGSSCTLSARVVLARGHVRKKASPDFLFLFGGSIHTFPTIRTRVDARGKSRYYCFGMLLKCMGSHLFSLLSAGLTYACQDLHVGTIVFPLVGRSTPLGLKLIPLYRRR